MDKLMAASLLASSVIVGSGVALIARQAAADRQYSYAGWKNSSAMGGWNHGRAGLAR